MKRYIVLLSFILLAACVTAGVTFIEADYFIISFVGFYVCCAILSAILTWLFVKTEAQSTKPYFRPTLREFVIFWIVGTLLFNLISWWSLAFKLTGYWYGIITDLSTFIFIPLWVLPIVFVMFVSYKIAKSYYGRKAKDSF